MYFIFLPNLTRNRFHSVLTCTYLLNYNDVRGSLVILTCGVLTSNASFNECMRNRSRSLLSNLRKFRSLAVNTSADCLCRMLLRHFLVFVAIGSSPSSSSMLARRFRLPATGLCDFSSELSESPIYNINVHKYLKLIVPAA